MEKNGYTMPELIIVIVVIGIGYFILANHLSYAFSVDYEEAMYNQTISYIEKNAKIYAEANLDTFTEYMTVDELVEKGVLLNTDGKVVDPRDENKSLNDLRIKLTLKNNKVTAEVLN